MEGNEALPHINHYVCKDETMTPVRERTPSRKEIAEYWSQAIAVTENSCFGCGFEMDEGDSHSLQRAHILSHRRGGSVHPGNLHLLCKRCHKTSEHFEGDNYWRWMFCQRNCHALGYQESDLLGLYAQANNYQGGE